MQLSAGSTGAQEGLKDIKDSWWRFRIINGAQDKKGAVGAQGANGSGGGTTAHGATGGATGAQGATGTFAQYK